MRHIDPHVHCRDWGQSYKATIKSTMELARNQGVVAIFDMPNTDPPIFTKELAERRLRTAIEEGCIDGYYLYMGITSRPDQIREAVDTYNSNPKVIGFKMYAGKSTGELQISEPEKQKIVYETLAECGYGGVLAVHCEKDSLARMDLWDPKRPQTWSLARPKEMETESVKEQVALAKGSGFSGTLHVAHVTTDEAVSIVERERRNMDITCGVTPHHVTLSTDEMDGAEGMSYKVNPPLRDRKTVKRMKELLMEGKIDWIETDHAPHSQEEKSYPGNGAFMSGIPSLASYSSFIDGLIGHGFKESQIEDLTYNNIKGRFTKVAD
ncbi:MAG: dihydroorotase family protein [Candidatus Micrarchaeota archaeon]|nr:dihydroorotase family protein [Candidatus Micrarchaeota archaeon]